jgi:hypothetical protein
LQSHLESDELLDEYKRHYRVGSEVDLQLRLTRGFSMLARRWRKYLDEHLRRIGQSQARWEALFAVAMSREGSALGTIAKRVGVEGPTFVRMIAQFEREGLAGAHANARLDHQGAQGVPRRAVGGRRQEDARDARAHVELSQRLIFPPVTGRLTRPCATRA